MIPIVSLIDILVILLIFFIATTTFRQQKTQIKVALPESKKMGESTPDTGDRSPITITKEQKIFLDGAPVEPDGLAEALTVLKQIKPGARLELEADTESSLGLLVKVWDALREAGYSVNDVPARIQKLEK